MCFRYIKKRDFGNYDMNFLCKLFRCHKSQYDCQGSIKAMQQLMQARIKELYIQHRNRVNTIILRWKKKYNQLRKDYDKEKSIPKRPSYCQPGDCPFNPENKKKPKLTVRDGKTFYENGGTIPIKLIGCSRWEALARAKNISHNWGTKSFHWYEAELIKSGINYVRHGTIPDVEFIIDHCKKMEEFGIIVELTIHNSQVKYDMGDPHKIINMTIDLPNVFYDVHNEFCDTRTDVERARELVRYIRDRGGICSAGAWGHCTHGLELSREFDPVLSDNQIISVHREWTPEWIKKYIGYNKPVIRNEFFDRGDLGFSKAKDIMLETIEAGAQGFQYYGFRDKKILPDLKKSDSESYDKYLEFAGELCKKNK